MNLIPTHCCSLCQISATNDDNLDHLRALIAYKKEEADAQIWYQSEEPGGHRAMFCITTPAERILADKLKTLGFAPIANFARRKGYPPGELTMWLLHW